MKTYKNKGPLFNFFEVVQIIADEHNLSEVDRKFGVVLGLSQNGDGTWGYAVDIYTDIECSNRIDGYDVPEKYLVKTGRNLAEKDIYDGSSVKVLIKDE